MMGERFGRRVGIFEGVSEFVSEGNPARLDEAVDEALRAAREAGATPGDMFDIRIRVTLREENQNVKAYSVIASGSGSGGT